jgi:antitoxin component of MazEF toxin-antitoxin module
MKLPRDIEKQSTESEREVLSPAIRLDVGHVADQSLRRYELAELTESITAENRHSETNWGPAIGAEEW